MKIGNNLFPKPTHPEIGKPYMPKEPRERMVAENGYVPHVGDDGGAEAAGKGAETAP